MWHKCCESKERTLRFWCYGLGDTVGTRVWFALNSGAGGVRFPFLTRLSRTAAVLFLIHVNWFVHKIFDFPHQSLLDLQFFVAGQLLNSFAESEWAERRWRNNRVYSAIWAMYTSTVCRSIFTDLTSADRIEKQSMNSVNSPAVDLYCWYFAMMMRVCCALMKCGNMNSLLERVKKEVFP